MTMPAIAPPSSALAALPLPSITGTGLSEANSTAAVANCIPLTMVLDGTPDWADRAATDAVNGEFGPARAAAMRAEAAAADFASASICAAPVPVVSAPTFCALMAIVMPALKPTWPP
jgi:hypothetical protein